MITDLRSTRQGASLAPAHLMDLVPQQIGIVIARGRGIDVVRPGLTPAESCPTISAAYHGSMGL